MRRRRQVLQVSTFPFLAVLLCAMGALILLLLVLDRRARVVAQARAMQAALRASAEDERAAAERRAEWERRCQALHSLLDEQNQQVLVQLKAVEEKAQAANTNALARQDRARSNQERLQEERARLAQEERDLAGRRVSITQTTQQADASRAGMQRLSRDLEQLERTLADLKTMRERQRQTYSLVPYRGKRGDKRRPLYIECTANGLIFHPDRCALVGPGVSADDVRREIERRVELQRAGVIATGARPEENAYLLMLVRPDGIVTYYQTMKTLQGLKVDFGYEFIEQDWILDFPEAERAARVQPWMLVEKSKVPGTPAPPPTKLPLPLDRAARPGPFSAQADAGKSAVPGSRAPGNPRFGGSAPTGSRLGGTSTGRRESYSGDGTGDVLGPSSMEGAAASGTAIRGNRGPGAAGGIRSGAAYPGGPRNGAPLPPGSRVISGKPSRDSAQATADATGGNTAPASLASTAPVRPATPSSTADRVQPSSGIAPTVVPAQPAVNGQASAGNVPGQESASAATSAEASAEGARDPLARLMPRLPSKQTPRPVPYRPSSLLGSRDWTIDIECSADALVLHPIGPRIALSALPSGRGEAHPLVKAVEQSVTRRQASVRPGEPPYRMQIRFLVRPDGLRAYYLAYPALEGLQIPMIRENLDPDDAVRPRGFGR